MHKDSPLEVVVAVISHQGKFLIARRKPGDSFAGYWEFPGGKVCPGEELKSALGREIDEELGIQVEVGVERMVVEHQYPNRTIRLHCFDCRLLAGEPRPLQCSECRWVQPEELGEFRFPPASEPLLKSLWIST